MRWNADAIGAFGVSTGGQLASMLAVLTDGNPTLGSGVRAAVAWSAPMDLVLLGELSGDVSDRSQGFLDCSTEKQCAAVAATASPITFVGRNDAMLYFVHSRHEHMNVATARAMDKQMDRVHARHTYVELPGSKHAAGYSRDDIPHSDTMVIEASLNYFIRYL